ncbi:MAG: DUF4292 domain-containing protein [Bacteroidales bacterium]|jgi:hypothetical protein|nr:DUF4292 domain-containing protein [Bacteroidales bacterium]
MKSRRRKKSRGLILLLILLLGVTACKVKQKTAIGDGTKKESVVKAKPVTPKIDVLDYEWLSYRISLSLSDYATKKETMTASAFFVNRRDSVIYISISKFGVEGVRAVITPDSVKYMNHLSKDYYCGDYSLVNALLGFRVNFHLLQAIFAGENVPDFEPNTFLMTLQQDTTVYVSPTRKNKYTGLTIAQELKADTNRKIVENNITELQTGAFIGMQYGDFVLLNDTQLFFQQMKVVVPSEKILLDCKLKSIKRNTPTSTSIKIPEKYKAIELN